MGTEMTYEGQIVLYNIRKSWGFIHRDGDGERIFFHLSNVAPGFTPSLGLRVAFEMIPPLSLGYHDQAGNVREAPATVVVEGEGGEVRS
jgi:cold shock CspA family protein